jgi:iron-sulfur cluster protein
MASLSIKKYREKIRESLNDEFLQKTLDNFTRSYPVSRAKAFEGLPVDRLIENVASSKRKSIAQLEFLYNKFKLEAELKGVRVHLAQNADQANTIIAGIARKADAKVIVKSKSMTSEETHLNAHLMKAGFEVFETDLGEWIIQLRGEGPSHMVMPAIHLSKEQVSDLFTDVTRQRQSTDVESLVRVARNELRHRFVEADMGITGANIAIAETGTLVLVTNEGNARLTTTMPRVNVTLAGLEKLVETIDEALHIIDILPKNATGQNISSYITWITGGSENTSNPSGNTEYHIVFLDNGRLKLASDPVFSEVLHCIRCGACANVCPVYGAIGGHRMGHTYIGPIGLLLTYFYHGEENAKHLIHNCTNCLACEKVCASGIKLPQLIHRVQEAIAREDGIALSTRMVGRIMRNRKLFHSLLRMGKFGQAPFKGEGQFIRHLPSVLFIKDQKFKSLPALAPKSFREIWPGVKPRVVTPRYRVGLFAGCLNDFVYPEQAVAAIRLLEKEQVAVEFPIKQSCCGLPLHINNDNRNAKAIAIQNMQAFRDKNYDYIVTLCASCASFLKNEYPRLVSTSEEVEAFASRIIDFSSLIDNVVDIKTGIPKHQKVAYHAPCHLCRGLNVKSAPRNLIARAGYTYLETPNEEVCCGFGGTYSLKFPEISAKRMNKKLDAIADSKADILVTDCPGCVMQLRGGAHKRNEAFEVKHIAELFNDKNQLNEGNVQQGR